MDSGNSSKIQVHSQGALLGGAFWALPSQAGSRVYRKHPRAFMPTLANFGELWRTHNSVLTNLLADIHQTLSFLSLIFLAYQGKPLKLTKDFCPLPNPLKPWKSQRKHRNNQGNSLLKINQGIPKNQGKEGQGSSGEGPPDSPEFR